MAERIFTTETRIEMNDPETKAYLETFLSAHSALYRKMYQQIASLDFRKKFPRDHQYVSYLVRTENITKRTANSMLKEIKGRLEAYHELKKTEKKDLEHKRRKLEERIKKLRKKVKRDAKAAAENKLSEEELERFRRRKASLYWKRNKLNKIRQRLKVLYEIIAKKRKPSICWGTKKLFRAQYNLHANGFPTHEAWHRAFVKNRDKNIYYVGTHSESNGNLMMQLTWNEEKDSFSLFMTKEKDFRQGRKVLVFHDLQFQRFREELITNCKKHQAKDKTAKRLSWRIVRRKDKWYLQAMLPVEEPDCVTNRSIGVIGLDFNDGFIEATRTNSQGQIAEQKHYPLQFHGGGNEARSEMEQTVCQIVKWAVRSGCSIGAEDLDFRKKKAEAEKQAKDKKYNRMIHALDYSRYHSCLDTICFRNGVELLIVDPKNTSKIGREKYCAQKKLNAHQAASYVIARRAQGYKDGLRPKPSDSKTMPF